jgi:agmatine deiminase
MVRTIYSTPKQDGFHMPAEFEAHASCWMLWPERTDNWRLGARPAQRAFASVTAAIARFEPVTVGASPAQYLEARHSLPETVRLVEISSDDAWMRDCGPTFVQNAQGVVRGVDWDFNAWGGLQGGLYYPWDQDELVAPKVLEIERLERYKADFVLEGGSIHVDGLGTLLTTRECLLNPNRNPEMSLGEIEEHLRQYLGVEKILWLEKGVYQDETSGHVDNLCCFVRPGVVALTWTEDQADPQYERSRQAYETLMASTDARGRGFEVYKIHQPGPLFMSPEESQGVDVVEGTYPRRAGARLAGSYINFYLPNRGIIVPTFDDPYDLPALQALQNLFPGREVVGIPAREILLGGGDIHCITLQQP